ncbi:cohesin subunit SA-3 [Bombina bombina]|uniref:cohesin subunit SA-3 n=1 Tax=Bombina bombina TaxID=8345 RepID=UPI00235B08F0|nr:cohesin subunit SA-3 [Bombina bombina]
MLHDLDRQMTHCFSDLLEALKPPLRGQSDNTLTSKVSEAAHRDQSTVCLPVTHPQFPIPDTSGDNLGDIQGDQSELSLIVHSATTVTLLRPPQHTIPQHTLGPKPGLGVIEAHGLPLSLDCMEVTSDYGRRMESALLLLSQAGPHHSALLTGLLHKYFPIYESVEYAARERGDWAATITFQSPTLKPRRSLIADTALSQDLKFVNPSDGNMLIRSGIGLAGAKIIVDDWLDSYKQERESGLLELINFLMQSCGCKGVVTQEMLEHMQNADIIRRMTEEFDEDTSDYPLSLSTLPWKKFRLNFGEFIETLVSRCQYNIIYDELLMDAFISLLTGLSDSQVRAFRHTSTFAAMKLMTGLVKVAQNLSVHQETNQRQYDVERAKIPVKMAPERLETLLEKRKELQENLQEIANMMNGIFKGVFVHRYRDTVPEIRALCMEEIGVWMHTYSKSFLNDSYLKYVGWTLHDKQGHVRLQCIRSLKGLYSVPEMAAKMELFTSRFKERMVSMVLDKDQQVAVEAIKVLGLISQNMEDILNTEDCESVYPLVYASSRALSSAAGAFLYQRLLDIKSNELSPKDRSRRESNALFFRLLVTFFIESEFHEHAAYLVDSLWDCAASQLRDWECQTDLLVVESLFIGLDNREEIAVIEIMVSAMRQAVEGTSPVGRVPVRKVVSVKDKKIQSEDKVRLTRHMILILPQLLAKFSADAEKMITLLKVPGFLELDLYCTERLERHLDLLLAQVHDVLEKHTEPDVLEACSRALYILCDKEQTSYRRSDIARSHMLDQLTDRFFQQIPDILQSSDLDEDEVYNTAATLKRLSALYSAHDLSRWELFDPCSRILRRGIDTGEISEQIVLPALTCCHFSLMWELSHLSNSNATQDKLDSLRKKMCLFCDICQSCLSDVKVTVREQAFILLSDLLVIFGGHMGRGNQSHLQILVYRPEPPLQAELAGFLLDHVFIDHEEKEQGGEKELTETQQIFLLHHRRNLLAGYCKLILYGALQLHSASEVFRHYAKVRADYGDLIKETLHRSRSINKEESTRAVLLSLTQAYTSHCLEGSSPPQRTSRFLLEIRELARQFALLFGPDQLRIRQDIVLLHKEGIKFCLRDPQTPGKRSQNLRFLDILSEFSPKLIKQDKRVILEYLEQTCKQYLPPQISDDDYLLSPLLAYKRSLGTDSDTSVTPSHGATRRSGARSRGQRKRPKISPPRKKRRTNEGEKIKSNTKTIVFKEQDIKAWSAKDPATLHGYRLKRSQREIFKHCLASSI